MTSLPNWKHLPLLVLTMLVLGLMACSSNEEGDLTAPTVSFSGTNPVPTSRSRYLAGTLEAGGTLSIEAEPAVIVSDLAVAEGRWSCRLDKLAAGTSIVYVKAVDLVGNQRNLTFALTYDPLSIDSYVSPLPGTSQTIGGLVDPAAVGTLTVTAIGAQLPVIGAVTVVGDHWSVPISDLGPGYTVLKVSIIHPDSDLGTLERSVTLTVSAAAPVLSIDPPVSPTNLASQTIAGARGSNLNVGVSAPSSSVGAVDLSIPDRWSSDLSVLNPGPNLVTVSATSAGTTATAHALIVYDRERLVAELSPADAAAEVDPEAVVQAVFTEPMDGTTLTAANFLLATGGVPVAASVTYDAALRVATLTPVAPLTAATSYSATLTTAVTSAAGAPLPAAQVWSFTTR